MTIDTLSKNEKLTLYGLVRWPTCNDRRLSEAIKLKMSTVTAIRNRLKREGYFKTVRIPLLERLGGELLSLSYLRLDVTRAGEGMVKTLKDVAGGIDDIFYAIADQFGMLSFSLCRNYTDVWADSERIHQRMAEVGALNPRWSKHSVAIFPIGQTRIFKFFDYSQLLRARFELELGEAEDAGSAKSEKGPPRHLSRIEKKVYHGLIKYPELVDNSVAKKIGVTRQSVTKIRKRFESEELMTCMRIPDFHRTGAEILSYASYEFAPSSTIASRKKSTDWAMKSIPAFFHIAGNREGIMIGLARNFETMQRQLFEVDKMYLEKGYFKDEPRLIHFSINDTVVVKDFNFAPVVKKVLEIEDEKAKG